MTDLLEGFGNENCERGVSCDNRRSPLCDPDCLRPEREDDRNVLSKGKAYLHFHEAVDGELFADARLSSDAEFARHNVSTKTSQQNFLALIENDLGVGLGMSVAATA